VLSLRQQLATAASQKSTTDTGKLQRDLAAAQNEIVQLKQQLAWAAPGAKPPAEVAQLRKELAVAQDEARTWAARQGVLSNTLEDVKKRLSGLNQDMLARDKKSQADASELAALNKELAAAKDALIAEKKRTVDLDGKYRSLESSRTTDLDKLKKHAAALSETVDLNQREMERLRSEIKSAKDRVSQLEGENRELQSENARLKK